MIKINDYIEGYECVGPNNTIKIIKGWVDKIITNKNKEVICYNIQADDSWKGHRGTSVRHEYGDIKYINNDNKRPKTELKR